MPQIGEPGMEMRHSLDKEKQQLPGHGAQERRLLPLLGDQVTALEEESTEA